MGKLVTGRKFIVENGITRDSKTYLKKMTLTLKLAENGKLVSLISEIAILKKFIILMFLFEKISCVWAKNVHKYSLNNMKLSHSKT